MMEKDGSGGSTDKRTELDAFLSAADKGMLDAIHDNLDLDTGFAQILSDLAGIAPTGRPTGPAEAEPDGHTHSYGHALDPVHACEVSRAAHKIPASADRPSHREPLYRHRALITLALAVVAVLNIAILISLSQNHGIASAQSGATATDPPFKPIAAEQARDRYFPRPKLQQLIVLANKTGASAPLRFAADSNGIGGRPSISYLRDSRGGPVLLLSGFPVGTAIGFLSIGAGRSYRTCSAISHWNYPFPSGGEQFSSGTRMCIAGPNGRFMLETVQSQPSGQIDVVITRFPAWA